MQVFDLRRQPRPLAAIPFFPGPVLLKYNPKFSCTLMAGTESGGFQMCDVGGLFAMPGSYQVGDTVTAMDVSTTGELAVFGDHQGGLYLWADKAAQETKAMTETPISVNPPGISLQTTIPDRRPPALGELWTEETPLTAAPLPPLHDAQQLLSDWPAMAIPPAKQPHLMDRAFMATVTGKDFVGYAPNPGFKRGQTYKGLAWLKRLRGDTSQLPGDDELDDLGGDGGVLVEKKAVLRRGGRWATIDKDYRLQEIKLGKLGIEDFAFHKYNQTRFGGLENTIPNRCRKSALFDAEEP